MRYTESMQFLFLGTGPAEAIPRQGHQDELCRDALRPHSKSRRLRSAGALTKGKTTLLFDAGPDIAYQLATHRVEKIDGALITHAHLDAAGGLAQLNAWAGRRAMRIPVFTERATLRRYGKFDHLDYQFVKSGGVAKIGAMSVRFFRVRHSLQPGFPTLGFRIGKFAYASDAASIPALSLKALRGAKTLVLDAAFWFGTNFRGHLRPEKSIRYAHWLGVDELFLTQTGHTYPPHAKAEEAVRAYARIHAPGLKTAIAYDGLHLKLTN